MIRIDAKGEEENTQITLSATYQLRSKVFSNQQSSSEWLEVGSKVVVGGIL